MQSITLQTPTQNCLVINDQPGPSGGVQIRIHGLGTIVAAEGYLELTNNMGASIKLEGPKISIVAAEVDVNYGALNVK
jgi:hypothetical protein